MLQQTTEIPSWIVTLGMALGAGLLSWGVLRATVSGLKEGFIEVKAALKLNADANKADNERLRTEVRAEVSQLSAQVRGLESMSSTLALVQAQADRTDAEIERQRAAVHLMRNDAQIMALDNERAVAIADARLARLEDRADLTPLPVELRPRRFRTDRADRTDPDPKEKP